MKKNRFLVSGIAAAVFLLLLSACSSPADPLESPPITSVKDLEEHLKAQSGGTAANPVAVKVAINIGGNGWQNLLDAIDTAGKYVDLNLSGSAMDGTEFNPDNTTSTGEDKIVSLVLPASAESIADGTSDSPTMRYFSNLKRVSGENVTAIGDDAFFECTSLTSVSFPASASIGNGAFVRCTSLTSVSLPVATSIGNAAFGNTGNLALTIILGASPPTVGIGMFSDVNEKTVTIQVPSASVSAYNTTWQAAFRGIGSNGGGTENTNITLNIEQKPL